MASRARRKRQKRKQRLGQAPPPMGHQHRPMTQTGRFQTGRLVQILDDLEGFLFADPVEPQAFNMPRYPSWDELANEVENSIEGLIMARTWGLYH